MSLSVTCPECQKSLKVKDETAGKKIRCPACSTVFVVPVPDEDVFEVIDDDEDVAPAPKKRRPVSGRQDDDLDEGRPVKGARRPKSAGAGKVGGRKKKSGVSGLVIAAVVGGALALLVCGGVLIAVVGSLGTAGVMSANWTTFRHPMGVAQVDLPGPPAQDKKDLAQGAQTYSLNRAGFVMSFTAIALPAELHANGPVNPNIIDLMFGEMERSTPAQFPGSQLLSSRRITNAAYPGLEMTLKIQQRFNSLRFYVVPGALVCVEFIAPTESGGGAVRDRFFGSLKDSAGKPIDGTATAVVPVTTSQSVPNANLIEQISQKPLREARKELKTVLRQRSTPGSPAPEPPPELARKVRYPSSVGELEAYITNPPTVERKWPAIVWISGGDCNSIDDGFFKPAPRSNDQTASVFSKVGIITMYPSLRGGNANPGSKEGFFGEVEDVIAAADFLAQQEGVDPEKIYLGGHSTGGTLALLVSESTNRFKAVFSFGPTNDIRGYGSEFMPFDNANPLELLLRTPEKWLSSIESPTYVMEGNQEPGNLSALITLGRTSKNPKLMTHVLKGANHFNLLAPITEVISRKIREDVGDKSAIIFLDRDLALQYAK